MYKPWAYNYSFKGHFLGKMSWTQYNKKQLEAASNTTYDSSLNNLWVLTYSVATKLSESSSLYVHWPWNTHLLLFLGIGELFGLTSASIVSLAIKPACSESFIAPQLSIIER